MAVLAVVMAELSTNGATTTPIHRGRERGFVVVIPACPLDLLGVGCFVIRLFSVFYKLMREIPWQL